MTTVAWTKVPRPFNTLGTPRIWFLPPPETGVSYRDRFLIGVGIMGPLTPDIWTQVAKPTATWA